MSKQTLYKFGYVPMTEASPIVIDTNEVMEERLRQLRQRAYEDPSQFEEAQFPNELQASDVARLLADDEDEPSQVEMNEGLLANARKEADELLKNARDEADRILEQVEAQAEEIKQSAYQAGIEAGKKEGYEAGRIRAMTELQDAQAELDDKSRKLDAEYEQKLSEMEPMLIDTLTGIYEHVMHAELISKKEFITKLLVDTIKRVEGCKDFIVHVAREEYEQVKLRKEELLDATAAAAATVEVIEDYSLASGECMVETENGIYDCSMDVQLAALRQQLMLLSYNRHSD